jgi:hypothetical protein
MINDCFKELLKLRGNQFFLTYCTREFLVTDQRLIPLLIVCLLAPNTHLMDGVNLKVGLLLPTAQER